MANADKVGSIGNREYSTVRPSDQRSDFGRSTVCSVAGILGEAHPVSGNHLRSALEVVAVSQPAPSVTTRSNPVVEFNGRPTQGRIQIYGHRACRGLYPEQTMPAYNEALRIGVDYVDMDIAMTKDGEIVVTHDLYLNPNLTRDQNGIWIPEDAKIKVYDLTLEELQKFNVGMLKPGTRYASFFPNQRPVDTFIPTLRSVIQEVKKRTGDRVGFQIEMKPDPTHPELTPNPREFASALYKLLKEENVLDRTEIQAFDWRCLIELNKIDSAVKTAYLSDHTTEVMTDEEKGTWMAGELPKNHGYSLPQMVHDLHGFCWEPYEMDLTKEQVDEAHEHGLKVVVWGWPEEEGGQEFNLARIKEMIEWGVDGIISDRPDLLRAELSNYYMARGIELPSCY